MFMPALVADIMNKKRVIMKKILKGMLILFVVLIFAAGGFVYYVYRTVNNVDQYSDRLLSSRHTEGV